MRLKPERNAYLARFFTSKNLFLARNLQEKFLFKFEHNRISAKIFDIEMVINRDINFRQKFVNFARRIRLNFSKNDGKIPKSANGGKMSFALLSYSKYAFKNCQTWKICHKFHKNRNLSKILNSFRKLSLGFFWELCVVYFLNIRFLWEKCFHPYAGWTHVFLSKIPPQKHTLSA